MITLNLKTTYKVDNISSGTEAAIQRCSGKGVLLNFAKCLRNLFLELLRRTTSNVTLPAIISNL